jgi:hypothetical protein
MPLHRLPILRSILVAASVFLLLACDRAEQTHAPSLQRAELMQLPFPGWKAQGGARIQTVDLSENTRAEVQPLYVVQLDDTHAALLTQTAPVDERDEPFSCHACALTVGAYFFERDDKGWRLTSRQDDAVESGLQGNLGTTGITKLADGHYAFTSEWGSCWQGYCGTWLVVLGLEPGKASVLSSGIRTSVDNEGAYGSCSALDNPKAADAEALSHECLDIDSTWKFVNKRLHLHFTGRLSELDDKGARKPTQKIAQDAEYAIVQGELQLVQGTNPVPGF